MSRIGLRANPSVESTKCSKLHFVGSPRTLELAMAYLQKIVLHCPTGYKRELDDLVEKFIADGVKFVGVVGEDCSRVEDIIDELVVGDGSDQTRFILTSFHEGKTVAEALEFARSLTGEYAGEVQLVDL